MASIVYISLTICSTDILSTDHRGTPEKPGRVMTVIEREFWETLNDPVRHAIMLDEKGYVNTNKKQLAHLETPTSSSQAAVWGAAYHIPATHAEEVHDYLDDREVDGYTVHYTSFYPSTPNNLTATPITCMVYIGLPTNPQFLRDPAHREPQNVAEVISKGHGQSGKNSEYLYMLEKALEGLGLGSADVHVTDLVKRVKGIEKEVADAEEKKAGRDVSRSLSISDAEAHVDFPRTE